MLNLDIFQHVLPHADAQTLSRLINDCPTVRRQCQKELSTRMNPRLVWYIGCPRQFRQRVHNETLFLSVVDRRKHGKHKDKNEEKWIKETRQAASGQLRDVLKLLTGQRVILVVYKGASVHDYAAALSWVVGTLRGVLTVDVIMEIPTYAGFDFTRRMDTLWRDSLHCHDFSPAFKLVHPLGSHVRAHITYFYALSEEEVKASVFPWSHGRPITLLNVGEPALSLTVPRPANHRNFKNTLAPVTLSVSVATEES